MNFRQYSNLTKVVIPKDVKLVTNSTKMFDRMQNLISADVTCEMNSMIGTYNNCTNLIGNIYCDDNIINMYMAYERCFNLTGSPVCGDKVVNMSRAYHNCKKITKSLKNIKQNV